MNVGKMRDILHVEEFPDNPDNRTTPSHAANKLADYRDARLVRALVRTNARLPAADEMTFKTDTLPTRCITQ